MRTYTLPIAILLALCGLFLGCSDVTYGAATLTVENDSSVTLLDVRQLFTDFGDIAPGERVTKEIKVSSNTTTESVCFNLAGENTASEWDESADFPMAIGSTYTFVFTDYSTYKHWHSFKVYS